MSAEHAEVASPEPPWQASSPELPVEVASESTSDSSLADPEPAFAASDSPGDVEPSSDDLSDDELSGDDDDTAEEVPEAAADVFSPPGSAFLFEAVRAVGPTAFGAQAQAFQQNINNPTIVLRGARHSGTKVATAPVASARLAAMAGAYVATGTDTRLDEQLARHRIAVLSGRPGSGRYTTACLALRRLSRKTVADLWLEADGRIDDIRGSAQQLAGGAYLWEPPADLTLDPLALSGLEAAMEQRDAMIVLIGQFGTGAVSGLQVVAHHEPSRRDVFAAQLRHRLAAAGRCLGDCASEPRGCRGACVESRATSYADDSDIKEAVKRHSCAEVAYLADMVAQRQPSGAGITDLLDELRMSVREAQRSQAANILDLGSGPIDLYGEDGQLRREQRAFRMSYVLLGRQPMALRQEAASWLREAFDDPQAHTTTSNVATLLGTAFDDWHEERHDAIGRLRHPGLARDLVDVAWNDRTDLHRPLLRWLDKLASCPERTLRVQAAVITGRLATYDFRRVRDELLTTWADHPRARLRQVAALALEQAFRTEAVRGKVRDELWRWLAGRSSLRRDTAARVLLTRVGAYYGSSALEGLRLVAADPMQRRSRLVPRVAQRCFQPRYAATFLRELVTWCLHDDWLVRLHAGRAMLRLAQRVRDTRGVPEPELLSLARDDIEVRATLVWLWQVALTQPFTAFEAWDALGAWLVAVGDDQVSASELTAFATDVWATTSLRTRARFHLEHRWQRQIPNKSLVAQLTQHVKET